MGEDNPVVGLVVPADCTTTVTWEDTPYGEAIRAAMLGVGPLDTIETEPANPLLDTSGAHPDKRPNRIRTRGPGKGKRAECVLLLDIAIQALQAAKERALGVTADMPTHERMRLLVPVLSDAGLAMRSVEEAVERWERGLV